MNPLLHILVRAHFLVVGDTDGSSPYGAHGTAPSRGRRRAATTMVGSLRALLSIPVYRSLLAAMAALYFTVTGVQVCIAHARSRPRPCPSLGPYLGTYLGPLPCPPVRPLSPIPSPVPTLLPPNGPRLCIIASSLTRRPISPSSLFHLPVQYWGTTYMLVALHARQVVD